MLIRLANHIKEIECNTKSNKYKVLRQLRKNGYDIEFDVLYYSPFLLEEEIFQDIGEEEGKWIRDLRPCLNYQIPKEGDFKHYEVNKLAKYVRMEDILALAAK